jgi:prevent-host-death family protein
MQMSVTIHEAKTNLSKLLKRVEAGEEIVISRGNKEIAKLAPLEQPKVRATKRRRGGLAHLREEVEKIDWLAPLPEEELALWEGDL